MAAHVSVIFWPEGERKITTIQPSIVVVSDDGVVALQRLALCGLGGGR